MVFAEYIFFSVPLERNNNGLIPYLLEQEKIMKCQWPGFTELSLPTAWNRYIHLYWVGFYLISGGNFPSPEMKQGTKGTEKWSGGEISWGAEDSPLPPARMSLTLLQPWPRAELVGSSLTWLFWQNLRVLLGLTPALGPMSLSHTSNISQGC